VYTGEMPRDDDPQMRKLLPPGFTPAGAVMLTVLIRSRRGPVLSPPPPFVPPVPVEPPPVVVVLPGPVVPLAPPAPVVEAPDVVAPDVVEPVVALPDVVSDVELPLPAEVLDVPAVELVPDAGARPEPFDSLTPQAATRTIAHQPQARRIRMSLMSMLVPGREPQASEKSQGWGRDQSPRNFSSVSKKSGKVFDTHPGFKISMPGATRPRTAKLIAMR